MINPNRKTGSFFSVMGSGMPTQTMTNEIPSEKPEIRHTK